MRGERAVSSARGDERGRRVHSRTAMSRRLGGGSVQVGGHPGSLACTRLIHRSVDSPLPHKPTRKEAPHLFEIIAPGSVRWERCEGGATSSLNLRMLCPACSGCCRRRLRSCWWPAFDCFPLTHGGAAKTLARPSRPASTAHSTRSSPSSLCFLQSVYVDEHTSFSISLHSSRAFVDSSTCCSSPPSSRWPPWLATPSPSRRPRPSPRSASSGTTSYVSRLPVHCSSSQRRRVQRAEPCVLDPTHPVSSNNRPCLGPRDGSRTRPTRMAASAASRLATTGQSFRTSARPSSPLGASGALAAVSPILAPRRLGVRVHSLVAGSPADFFSPVPGAMRRRRTRTRCARRVRCCLSLELDLAPLPPPPPTR